MLPIRRVAAHDEVRRLLRFGLTGIAGFTADFGALVTTHGRLGLPLGWSLAIAYAVGGTVHYCLTRWWVFPAVHDSPEIGRVARYLALASINAAATLLIVPALTQAGLDYRLAKVLCVAVLFATNYVLMPRFVMPGAGRRAARSPGSAGPPRDASSDPHRPTGRRRHGTAGPGADAPG